ncbi:urease accessory protein UreF [Reinekea blandensis]|uniref:Urease accessory protein UreF n=1 Tax=Reinekea blandensis MED297 TaxID=314283 RepID=A4BBR2_9GAMM|nr:urease accessory UreF family protein [Reinekea blandensis]EAR10397.1 putative urease accessory protein UreF [Reinekea sp. MED297] [Reinekea blandensis MED297]
MAITTTSSALLRLLQLSSVSLPVGGFSFSQGLESAIEQGWIRNSKQTAEWLRWQLTESVARIDLPVLFGAMSAMSEGHEDGWRNWNDRSLANRETAELRLTETAMGEALQRLLKTLDIPHPDPQGEVSFVALFAVAAQHWSLSPALTAQGFVWSWLENQVAAATKLVPLGQSQAQLLLGELQPDVAIAITQAETLDEFSMGGALPALSLASCWHETQYSRLFRS